MAARFSTWIRSEWPTVGIIAAGCIAQLYLVLHPVEVLVNTILPDDAFYYFAIARNIVAGLGSTFDTIAPTDGYHPLWMLVLVPIFKLFASPFPDLAPVRVALLVQVALNVCTAFLIARVLSRFTRSGWVRAFGILVFFLNPFFLYETVNGLETALALCLFSIFFVLVLRMEEGKSFGGYPTLGIVAGCMILARLDMVFYLVAFLIWLLVRYGFRAGWMPVFLTGLYAAIPVTPFIIWNVSTFGSLLTSSAAAETLFNHVLTIQDNGGSFAQTLKATIYYTQYELDQVFMRTGMYAIASAFLGGLCAFAVRGDIKLPRHFRELPAWLGLFFGFLLLFVSDASIRWSGRSWYFISFDFFLAIIAVIVADVLFEHLDRKKTAAVILAAIVLFSFYVDWSKNLRGDNNALYGQNSLITAAQWMNANLPQGAVRGGMTAGIQGYFSNAPFIDLDGLVSNQAYDAMKQRDLWNFITQNVKYLSINDDDLTYRFKSFLGTNDPLLQLQLLYQVPGGATIYRVR